MHPVARHALNVVEHTPDVKPVTRTKPRTDRGIHGGLRDNPGNVLTLTNLGRPARIERINPGLYRRCPPIYRVAVLILGPVLEVLVPADVFTDAPLHSRPASRSTSNARCRPTPRAFFS